ncbi:MAG: glycoside hydrolase family 2 protein [Flavobacteriaceae bacterium]
MRKILLLLFVLISFTIESQERFNNQMLNGEWEIIYDENNEGKKNKFHSNDGFNDGLIEKIYVPSVWERYKKDYEGVVYYRTKFNVSKSRENKKIHLNFNASNYITEVYVNDNSIGFHEGGFSPFSFNIEHVVDFDNANTLIVKVMGPITIQDKVIDGIGQMETPQWRGSYTGGIWQDVFLSFTGQTHIEDVFIIANYENGNVELKNKIVNGLGDGKYRYRYSINNLNDKNKNTLKHKDIIIKNSNLVVDVNLDHKVKNHKLWSPDDPQLYLFEVYLDKIIENEQGLSYEQLDHVTEKFGFREFTVKNERFYLNGNPIYLKAAFFEGLYPIKLSFPDSDDMMIKEILLAKKAGFNMIRPWRKPPPKEWLHLADSIGVLTVGSMAIECMDMPIESPYLPQRVENEITEAVLRDRNHPSIVQWELFNEIRRPVLANMLKPMSLKARELDPTRMILDESGGWAYGANLYLPFSNKAFKFNDIHNYPGPNITNNKFDGFLTIGNTKEKNIELGLNARTPGRNVVPDISSYVSEIGYGSLPDLENNEILFREKGNPITYPYIYHINYNKDIKKALKETGLDKIFKSATDFYLKQQEIHGIANKRMLEAIRSNPTVIGYCVHALTAGDWIIGAGLLDLWRNPKGKAYDLTKEANEDRIIVIRTDKRNYYQGESVKTEIKGINDKVELNGNLSIKIKSKKNNKVLYENNIKTKLKNGISLLHNSNVELEKGNYLIEANFNSQKTKLFSTIEFSIYDLKSKQTVKKIALANKDNKLKKFLIDKGFEVVNFDQKLNVNIPVMFSNEKAEFINSSDGNVVKNEDNQDNLLSPSGPSSNTKNSKLESRINELNSFVQRGGNVIYLSVPGKTRVRKGPNLTFIDEGESYLPVKFVKNISQGLWDGILHINSNHKIFKNLPTDVNMSNTYENIAPTVTMRGIEAENIVNTIAFDRIPNGNIMKRNYIGSGDVWSGSDLSVVKHGKGKIILSTLKLIENLGYDPVAEIVLMNMINYTD